MKNVFLPGNILIPKTEEMEKWSVIACDQFTSQPEYWEDAEAYVGEAPSALKLIFPEARLGENNEQMISQVRKTMEQYLSQGMFTEYKDAFVFVERTLLDGSIRKGIVGMIDLEAYDYSERSISPIRATEKTVPERIPPRKQLRQNALLDFSHVLLFCDDEENLLFQDLNAGKEKLPLLYDFDLMAGGGHITGRLIQGETAEKLCERLQDYGNAMEEKYQKDAQAPMLFAVGDGNHSLAAAKACYEELKLRNPGKDLSTHPARYALVELVNLHEEAQKFEPIHRIVKGADPERLLEALKNSVGADEGFPVTWYAGNHRGTVFLDPVRGQLPLGILQNFLDEYLCKEKGTLDYIHGERVLQALSKEEDSVGFVLPAVEKESFFKGIIEEGAFPRKTFSAGHAEEKRYYLESRRL